MTRHRLIAALDDSAAATPVLAVASAFADLFAASVEAVHVSEDGGRTVRALTDRAGYQLRELTGPVVDAIRDAAEPPDVLAVVVGARRDGTSTRPAGHVAVGLATLLRKPVVVVPPRLAAPVAFEHVLVPMDSSTATAEALEEAIDAACGHGLEVTLLHVHERATVPAFADQPQHEIPAWVDEFVARFAPTATGDAGVELRVGAACDHVLDVAAEIGADLILLGWSQDLSPGHAAVVRRVLEASPVPIVLVPVAHGEKGE